MTNFSPSPARPPAAESTGSASGDALIASLHRQLELYEQLSALAQRQGALIGVGDGSPLLAIIDQRQNIIDELQSLHRAFEATKLGNAPLNASQRREAHETSELIAAIRARIFEQDERDRATLREAKSLVGGELRKLSHAGHAVRAYGGNPAAAASVAAPTTSRFTDHQG